MASWTKEDKEDYIYHDSIGSGRLDWNVQLEEVEDSDSTYLQRKVQARRQSQRLSDKFF